MIFLAHTLATTASVARRRNTVVTIICPMPREFPAIEMSSIETVEMGRLKANPNSGSC